MEFEYRNNVEEAEKRKMNRRKERNKGEARGDPPYERRCYLSSLFTPFFLLFTTVEFWFGANESLDTDYGQHRTNLVRSKQVVRGSSPNQPLTTNRV
jgi:hypothetical protein